MTQSENAAPRSTMRMLARELTFDELDAVSGGAALNCFQCVRTPVGGNGGDEQQYVRD
jgi:hypothetical protein